MTKWHRILTGKLRKLWRVRKKATVDMMIAIYKQMVLPYIEYGDHILGSASNNHLRKIQVLQNKCLRACFGVQDGRKASNEELRRRDDLCGAFIVISSGRY